MVSNPETPRSGRARCSSPAVGGMARYLVWVGSAVLVATDAFHARGWPDVATPAYELSLSPFMSAVVKGCGSMPPTTGSSSPCSPSSRSHTRRSWHAWSAPGRPSCLCQLREVATGAFLGQTVNVLAFGLPGNRTTAPAPGAMRSWRPATRCSSRTPRRSARQCLAFPSRGISRHPC